MICTDRLCGVTKNQHNRVSTQEHLAHVTVLADLFCLILSLPSLGLLCPHLLHVRQNPIEGMNHPRKQEKERTVHGWPPNYETNSSSHYTSAPLSRKVKRAYRILSILLGAEY